ncbi:MAG TPA: homoserine dehydrogenase, partial [Candidatus Limnocylindria bacterium]|nr:homoserine dehydrogenase [Candidatus Limnocylindria bacterium]
MERLRIGLIGWGTMGAAFGELVDHGPLPVSLATIAVRDPARARAIPMPDTVEVVTPDEALDADIVVELAG